MFYYYSMENGKVRSVHRVEKISVEEFYRRKEELERKDLSVKYEIVPKEMESLAEYAVEMREEVVDYNEMSAIIENIREELYNIIYSLPN